MKKLLLTATAALALLGVVACSSPSSAGSSAAASTLSKWQIKGSQDGWSLHQLSIDQLNSNKLTYVMSTPFQSTYQFVLVGPTAGGALGADPAQKFDVVATANNVVPSNGTAFTLVAGTTTAGSGQTHQNAAFHADFTTYTVTVDITDPANPSVKLVAGTTANTAVTLTTLLQNLQIKGNQFSKIDGATVATWTATSAQSANINAGAGTVSWDVYVDNKSGTFGLNSTIDGWIAGPKGAASIDVTSLTTPSSAATSAMALTTSNTDNLYLTNVPKANATYTVTVTATAPASTYGTGSYSLSVTLKTASTTNWAFSPWTTVYFPGAGTEFGNWTAGSFPSATVTSGIATKQITASATTEAFKINPENAWGGKDVGFSGVDVGAGSITLASSGGNISFAATINTTYTIKVDFTTANYIANGVPTVTVTTP